ncbi:MAG TPA: hypothetical protein DCE55_14890 [Planctomycetaceae bacterium]|nr:hypothetical protein [Planctomycetaceae bacterium]
MVVMLRGKAVFNVESSREQRKNCRVDSAGFIAWRNRLRHQRMPFLQLWSARMNQVAQQDRRRGSGQSSRQVPPAGLF